LSTAATLTANGWMDSMENIESGSTDDQNHTGLIFTDEPVFTAIAKGFPAVVVFYIAEDGIMYVTIQ
jgi:hypothetical protein